MTQSKHTNIIFTLICSVFSFVLCQAAHAQAKQATINITTEYFHPYNIPEKKGGAIYGQSADKVHDLFKRSHIPYQMTMMSWNRALELARKNEDTCVFSTARTKERESSFQWIGPISTGVWSIFGKIEKLGNITQIEQIKQSTIGTEVGNFAVSFLSEKGFKVVTSNESITSFKNLEIGRIDYVATGDVHGKEMIKENNLENKIVWLFDYGSTDYYLACNLKMKAETIALLNLKLNEMKVDGTFKNINLKYQ